MTSEHKKNDPVLVVGAGVFGLATAHQLASAGYTNITVLEKDGQIPSRFSAGYDLNKIVRPEYADSFYTALTLEAIKKWQEDPLYKPYFHQVGFLNVTSGSAPKISRDILQKYLASVAGHPEVRDKIQPCPDSSAIKTLIPALSGPVKGWSGYLNSLAGYAHAADAMKSVYEDCLQKGVSFRLGPHEGEVAELLFAPGTRRCIGARTISWPLLSQEEAEKLRGIPVINVRDIGFFFEPDLATNKLKVCHMGGGYTNSSGSTGISLPPSRLADSDFILKEDEEASRRLLREALPHLADRPLIDNHLCWFADSDDYNFVIDYVPETERSLAILSGDSGHGFKMLPIMGDLAMKLLVDGQQSVSRWKWKESKPGDTVAWRTGSSSDLATTPRAKL
ncbi:hypothetical protein DTO166G4_1874 [Paecilomyces variotii]|nr:hypothetical protein DTO166G4_1874 [Paecilomyces variotii]KAJ9239630.1 hypothetical protein DTO166G5_2377 [Paecilomyces variotii]